MRELDAAWNPGAWSAGTGSSFTDPESRFPAPRVGRRPRRQTRAADAATGADATADLQAVADEVQSGGPAVLDIPAGTYEISSTILLRSGTIMDDPGVTLEAAADWQRPVPGTTAGNLLNYTMVANADYASSTVQDSDIQIRNVAFNWGGFVNFGSAAVRFINAENVLVQKHQLRRQRGRHRVPALRRRGGERLHRRQHRQLRLRQLETARPTPSSRTPPPLSPAGSRRRDHRAAAPLPQPTTKPPPTTP